MGILGLGLAAFSRWVRQGWVVLVAMLAMALTLLNLGCASLAMSLAEQYPGASIHEVCVHSPGTTPKATHWVHTDEGVLSNDQGEEFDHAARYYGQIFVFNDQAPPTSVLALPSPHNLLACPAGKRFLADETAVLPRKVPCPEELVQTWGKPDPSLLAQVPPERRFSTGGCMAPGPLTAREQAIAAAKGEAQDIGKQFGQAVGYYEGKLNELFPLSNGKGLLVYVKRDPSFLLVIHETLTKALNGIPELPTYEDPDVANAALLAFEQGYGAGMAKAQLDALAVSVGFEILYIAAGNLGALAETAGIKALRFALTRVRSMPIFIPGTTSGVGFFLRIPKPPAANANAPSLPPGVIAPPVTGPPPFGNLSRAAEFGIKPDNQLRKAIQGTGLQGHHLIEQRFKPFVLKGDPRMKLTVAVTDLEHQLFTNAWKNKIAYGAGGTYKATDAQVLAAARMVYAKYPAILKALGL